MSVAVWLRNQTPASSALSRKSLCAIDVGLIKIENVRPIILLSAQQERDFLAACDDWENAIFLTLMCTGLRPGELCHLLLPGDLDLQRSVLRIRNKPRLGWSVKTRAEREIPLHPSVQRCLERHIGERRSGAVFRTRRFNELAALKLPMQDFALLEGMVDQRVAAAQRNEPRLNRKQILVIRQKIWRDLGAIDEDDVRISFIRVCNRIGLVNQSAPKVLRHGFATMLQDGNVDPLIRNLLMGHSVSSAGSSVVQPVSLGMTGVYTHSRFETVRQQLINAIDLRATVPAA